MPIVLLDTFEDADGVALADHSPEIGGPYTDDTPGWEILGNKLVETSASQVATFPFGYRTGWVEFTWDKGAMDPADSFTAGLGNPALTHGVFPFVQGGQSCDAHAFAAAQVAECKLHVATIKTLGNVLLARIGPSYSEYFFNGVLVGRVARGPAQTLAIALGSLSGNTAGIDSILGRKLVAFGLGK